MGHSVELSEKDTLLTELAHTLSASLMCGLDDPLPCFY